MRKSSCSKRSKNHLKNTIFRLNLENKIFINFYVYLYVNIRIKFRFLIGVYMNWEFKQINLNWYFD